MEAHPIDERKETRKQQKKESHLQQHIRKRKHAQIENIAKRRKLFTLVDGKIVRTEPVLKDLQSDRGSHRGTSMERTDLRVAPVSAQDEGPREESGQKEWAKEQHLDEDESDPLGLGFELD